MPFGINHLSPVLFGANISLRTGMRLREMGVTKALFVYDQGVKKAGIPQRIIANADALGIQTFVYEGVLPDPPDYTIDEATAIGRQNQVDAVIGIGGGSSMDTAKAVNMLQTNEGSIKQYLGFGRVQPKNGKTLVLIPTTAGTGSEVTQFCVLTDSSDHKKKGPGGNFMRANLAIVDPVLSMGMPPSVTADTGMDAFAHSAEAITSGSHNPMSDLLGEQSIKLVMKSLRKAVKDGKDLEARSDMAFAATLGGFAFADSITHLGHSIAHTLGALHHIPHGNACAIALPEITNFTAEANPNGIYRIAAAMGLKVGNRGPKATGILVRDAIRQLNTEIGMKTLRQWNVKESDLMQIAIDSEAGIGMASPKKADVNDYLAMIRAAWEL